MALPAIGRRYREMIQATGVSPGVAGLRLVNELGVEEYLRGMGEVLDPSWPQASLRAQAIAARTYALRAMKTSGEICAGQRCQVYLGQQAEYPAMDEAVARTAGQVVVFSGALASTVYSANAGGMSASTEEGFGPTVAASASAFPYLRPAPYLTRDRGHWSVSVALDRVADRLGYRGTVSSVSVPRVGPSGRALSVVVEGTAGPRMVAGTEFASALGLRSTLFRARVDVADQAPAPPPVAALQVPPEQAAAAAASPAPAPAPGSMPPAGAASGGSGAGGSTRAQPAAGPGGDDSAPAWPVALFGLGLAVCVALASRRRAGKAEPEMSVAGQEQLRAALRAAGERTARLIEGLDDIDRSIPGSEWTVGEAATHVLVGLRGYTAAARGEIGPEWRQHIPDSPRYPERVSAITAGTLRAEPRRDAATLGRLLREGVEAFLAATEGQPADTGIAAPWYGDDATLALSDATRLLLGEQVVHGYDIAQAVGQRWPIEPTDACLIFPAVTAMMPRVFNAVAAGGASVACDIRLRGGPRAVLTVSDGSARVEPWTSQRVDCHLSADPAAFLLVGYGRINQWRAIARGQLLAWGRKPWLALRLRGFFFNP